MCCYNRIPETWLFIEKRNVFPHSSAGWKTKIKELVFVQGLLAVSSHGVKKKGKERMRVFEWGRRDQNGRRWTRWHSPDCFRVLHHQLSRARESAGQLSMCQVTSIRRDWNLPGHAYRDTPITPLSHPLPSPFQYECIKVRRRQRPARLPWPHTCRPENFAGECVHICNKRLLLSYILWPHV